MDEEMSPEEKETIASIVNPEMLEFARQMQSAMGKMKQAHETQTNCLLHTREVEAVLGYMQSVQDHLRSLHLGLN